MKILPTLNIQNGKVVPVVGGAEACGDLQAMIGFLIDQGCHRLALVDVDAARGHGNNREQIAKAMQRFHANRAKVFIQVGGGIRSSDHAQFFLDHGANWLLVGTILHRSPILVDQLLARFRENLTAGLDARAGDLQSAGWLEPARLQPESAGARIREHGFKRVLFMDIPTDSRKDPDFQTARLIANSSHVSLFMGGSIQSLDHLHQAMKVPGLQGVALDALALRADAIFASSLNLQHI